MQPAQTKASEADDLAPTRRTLLARLRDKGDNESWRVFFDTYWRLLYEAAIRAGLTDADAQDIVQETILEVSNTIHGFEHSGRKGAFKRWLLNLAGWRITDRLRERYREEQILQPRKREQKLPSETATIDRVPDPASANVTQFLEEAWRLNVFEVAVERIKRKVDARQFQMFDLYVLKERPVGEVAKALGVFPPTVYMAKSRISRMIKKEVAYLESTPI
jgi:RNA polymerase sigma factor (sigma-70 family)